MAGARSRYGHTAGRGFRAHLRRRLRLARAALVWERLWPALWPAVFVAGLALAVGLFDLLPWLPGWLHALVLAAFALAFLEALRRGLRTFHLPGTEAARRRLERASGLGNRPLAALQDRRATGDNDPVARALWVAHRRRMRAAVRRLKVGLPRAGLARCDPLALRAALVLVLIVAMVDAGGDAGQRLVQAVTPDFSGFGTGPASLTLWIAPPDYTGLAPIVLAKPGPGSKKTGGGGPTPGKAGPTAADTAVAVPTGSVLLARVEGGRGVPTLMLGDAKTAFEAAESGVFEVRAKIDSAAGPGDHPGDRLVIRQGHRELGAWTLKVIADAPPTAALSAPLSVTQQSALRIKYRAEDDYGLVRLTTVIRRQSENGGANGGAGAGGANGGKGAAGTGPTGTGPTMTGPRLEIALPLARPAPKQAEGTAYPDLTANPWAGLKIGLWIEATDAAGQTGAGKPVFGTLPERVFTHPVAKAIVAERKKLSRNPGLRREVARALARIASTPADYGNDLVVFMALRTAHMRLNIDHTPAAIAGVQALLWDTALRLEEGELALARRDLREVEKALTEALAKGADQSEIERLLDEMKTALDRYLESLARSGMASPAAEADLANPSLEGMTRKDLTDLLDRARELSRTGDRAAAQEMLSRLQNILENLRTDQADTGSDVAKARKTMDKLRRLIERQQKLLDRSFDRARRAQPPPRSGRGRQAPPRPAPGLPQMGLPQMGKPGQGAPQMGTPQMGTPQMGKSAEQPDGNARDAAKQEALRFDLGDAMVDLGEMLNKIPGPLGRAERAMRDAKKALERGTPGDAVTPQAKALDQLQQGARAAARDMVQKMQESRDKGQGQAGGRERGQGPARLGQGRDPLGRPLPGAEGVQGSRVRIPDEMEVRRARKILDELRRRAGESGRPRIERDYIQRLLPRF